MQYRNIKGESVAGVRRGTAENSLTSHGIDWIAVKANRIKLNTVLSSDNLRKQERRALSTAAAA